MGLFFLKRLQFSGVPMRGARKKRIRKQKEGLRLTILKQKLTKNEKQQEKRQEKKQKSSPGKKLDLITGLEYGMLLTDADSI